MEKQLHARSSTHNNLTHTFDRIFSKARGVELFPEEKTDILKSIEKMHLATANIKNKNGNENEKEKITVT